MSHKLVNKSYFSMSRAEMVERYELWREEKTIFGRWKWRPVKVYHPIEFPMIVSGDLAWAKKMAKHYKIEVPE